MVHLKRASLPCWRLDMDQSATRNSPPMRLGHQQDIMGALLVGQDCRSVMSIEIVAAHTERLSFLRNVVLTSKLPLYARDRGLSDHRLQLRFTIGLVIFDSWLFGIICLFGYRFHSVAILLFSCSSLPLLPILFFLHTHS